MAVAKKLKNDAFFFWEVFENVCIRGRGVNLAIYILKIIMFF